MIEYMYKGAKILFVGINPHHGSYARGVPFSNNKTFWYLLSDAGLIKESREELKNDDALSRFYRERFNKVYGYGLVNVVNRPTRDVTELKPGEEAAGRRRILNIAENHRPAVICFVGKISYLKFSGDHRVSFGRQEDIRKSQSYVMHFPLRGKAEERIRELKTVGRMAGLAIKKSSGTCRESGFRKRRRSTAYTSP